VLCVLPSLRHLPGGKGGEGAARPAAGLRRLTDGGGTTASRGGTAAILVALERCKVFFIVFNKDQSH